MRVLIASTGGAGHFGPLLPFADALAARGDEVLFAIPPEAEGKLGGHAYRLGAAAPREIWDGFEALSREQKSILGNREWFGRLCTAALLPAVEAVCDEWRPDLVLREAAEYASAIAAEARGIAHAQIAISKAEVEWGSLQIAAPVLPAGIPERLREEPYLSRFPASLDPSPYPDTRRYRESAAAAHRGGHLRQFGSHAADLGYDPYRALLAAVEGLDMPVLLTTGAELDLGPLPENVTVERWVPQAEALADASLVVCHGGSGTTLGALAAGLPLVLVPMFADQFENARTIAAAGAGLIAEPDGLRARDRDRAHRARVPPSGGADRRRAAIRPGPAVRAALTSAYAHRRRRERSCCSPARPRYDVPMCDDYPPSSAPSVCTTSRPARARWWCCCTASRSSGTAGGTRSSRSPTRASASSRRTCAATTSPSKPPAWPTTTRHCWPTTCAT